MPTRSPIFQFTAHCTAALFLATGDAGCSDDVVQATENGTTGLTEETGNTFVPTTGSITPTTGLECDLQEPETGPGQVGEWSEVINWEIGDSGPEVVCDDPPCEEGPGFIAVHAVHLPTGKLLLWDGLDNPSGEPNEYLWSINENTFQYVPAAYSRNGCAFDGRVDCETETDCEAYCEEVGKDGNANCVNPDTSCDAGLCTINMMVVCTTEDECQAYCDTIGSTDPACNTPGDFTCEPVSDKAELFCSGHTHGFDGIVTVAGGNVTGSPNAAGKRELAQFIETEEWARVEDVQMNAWRWYPTVIQLADGRIFVEGGDGLNRVEIYDPSADPETAVIEIGPHPADIQGGQDQDIFYPFLFQIRSGLVFYGGAEGSGDPKYWAGYLFDTQIANSWIYDLFFPSSIPGGSAVMYEPGKIMKSGGCTSSLSRCPAFDKTEIIDFSQNTPSTWEWQDACPMSTPRHFHTLTILPDGKVLATGGNTEGNGQVASFCNDGTGPAACNPMLGDDDCTAMRCTNSLSYETCDGTVPDCEGPAGGSCFVAGGTCASYVNADFATLNAEMWDPGTLNWTVLAAQERPRMYHSIAILLPDGRVLTAGGGKRSGLDSQHNAEFFSPPYLFQGPRPTIMSLPEEITIGVPFDVVLGNAESSDIERVTLIRLGSVTHQFNMDQRFIELEHSVQTTSSLRILTPSDVNVAVPGWYMLFVLDDGVPSLGEYIKILPNE